MIFSSTVRAVVEVDLPPEKGLGDARTDALDTSTRQFNKPALAC